MSLSDISLTYKMLRYDGRLSATRPDTRSSYAPSGPWDDEQFIEHSRYPRTLCPENELNLKFVSQSDRISFKFCIWEVMRCGLKLIYFLNKCCNHVISALFTDTPKKRRIGHYQMVLVVARVECSTNEEEKVKK